MFPGGGRGENIICPFYLSQKKSKNNDFLHEGSLSPKFLEKFAPEVKKTNIFEFFHKDEVYL